MRKLSKGIAILALTFSLIISSAEARPSAKVYQFKQELNESGNVVCVLSKKNRWISGKNKRNGKVLTFQSLLKDAISRRDDTRAERLRKINKKRNRQCQALYPDSPVQSLTSLPDTSKMLESRNESLQMVSGTPPALPEIPHAPPKNVFWEEGAIDSIIAGNPTQNQCNQFFGGQSDGESGGMGACLMAQNVGYSFESIVMAGSSLCYMKNAPSEANLTAGGISLVSGSLPNGNVTELFTPGNSERLVRVNVLGGEFGEESVFIRVHSNAGNRQAGNLYAFDLWFCEGGDEVLGAEEIRIRNNGRYLANSQNRQGENGGFVADVTAWLTLNSQGSLVFDTSKDRIANIAMLHPGEGFSFKAEVTITGDDQIKNKAFDVFDSNQRKSYSLSNFTGDNLNSLRFLDGAFKVAEAFGDDLHSFEGATEYRDTHYMSAPNNALFEVVTAFNFDDDSFFDNAPAVNIDLSDYSCSAQADVVVAMDMDNGTMQQSVAECENNMINGMNFCFSDDDISAAQQNYFNVCQGP